MSETEMVPALDFLKSTEATLQKVQAIPSPGNGLEFVGLWLDLPVGSRLLEQVYILEPNPDELPWQSSVEAQRYFVKTKSKGELVGEVGWVEFTMDGLRVGRIQELEILPKHQNADLFLALTIAAEKRNLNALCWKAEKSHWSYDWAKLQGFESIGRWQS